MVIDDKTKISLFAVAVAVPFLIGAIMWLTTVDNKASAAGIEIQVLKALLLDVRERVIRIEEYQKEHN